MTDGPFDALSPTPDEIAAVQQPLPDALRRHAAAHTAPTPAAVARLIARQPTTRLRRPPRVLPVLAVAAAVLLSLRAVPLPEPPVLAPIAAHPSLSLPSGSLVLNADIQAEGSGSLDVVRQGADGASVRLTDGAVTFTVDPSGSGRDLTVSAGPVTVEVTGTRFTVSRSERTGVVTVVVHRGSVRIRHPDGSLPLSASGGEWRWPLPEPPASLAPAPAPTPEPEAIVVAAPDDAVEKSTGLLVGILDAVEGGQPPEAVLSMTETFLRVYPDSPFREEVEAIRLQAMAEVLPAEEALAAVRGWLLRRRVSPRRAELLVLAGTLESSLSGCADALPYYREAADIGSLTTQQQARSRIRRCAEP